MKTPAPRIATTLAGMLVLQLGTPPIRAQPADDGTVLAGQIELPRLLDVAAQRLRITIEYDPTQLKGTSTIRAEGSLTDEQLWSLANQSLASRGFTTIATGIPGVLSVVKLADAPAAVTPKTPETIDPLAGFAAVVYTPQHRSTKELADALTKLGTKSGGTATLLDERRLLIADLRPRLLETLRLLREMDAVEGQMTAFEFPLRNTPAPQMLAALTQFTAKRELSGGAKLSGEIMASPSGTAIIVLAPEHERQTWESLVASLDQRPPIQTATYAIVHADPAEVAGLVEQVVKDPLGAADPRWRLVPDPLTGSLVVTATADQHRQIKDLVARMDRRPTEDRRPMRSFVVRHRNVSDLRDILEELLQSGAIEAAVTTPEAQEAAPESGPTVVQFPPPPLPSSSDLRNQVERSKPRVGREGGTSSPVNLTVDEGTNTIIASGPPELLAQIEELLKQLDVRQPQVMLEVLMVNLSETQTRDLGVELEDITITGDVRIRLSSLFGLGTRTADGADPAPSNGFTGIVLSPGDFSVLIRALETINHGRALSMPKLLVGNNQEAVLNSVLEQPYVSVNASNSGLNSTSFGGTREAGTQIGLKPQISDGDSLILSYRVSLSAFVGAPPTRTVPPPKQVNNIDSVATIPDGYTVVVGGIELDTESKGVEQVPLIGDVPFLGELFKSRNRSKSNSRFYVFIRANILRGRGFEDLKYISDQDVARTGIDDGWPEVEPRIIR